MGATPRCRANIAPSGQGLRMRRDLRIDRIILGWRQSAGSNSAALESRSEQSSVSHLGGRRVAASSPAEKRSPAANPAKHEITVARSVFGGGAGGMWTGNSGDKSHAVQALRVGRAAPNFAPAFGLRVLEHRFVPRRNEVTSWDYGHFHFGIRVLFELVPAGGCGSLASSQIIWQSAGNISVISRWRCRYQLVVKECPVLASRSQCIANSFLGNLSNHQTGH